MAKANGGLPKSPNNKKRTAKKREIDVLTKNVQDFWDKSYVFIQKTKIKTWKGVFVIAFVAGAAVAIIWSVSSNIQSKSKAEGEEATLSLVTPSSNVAVGDTFNVDVDLVNNRDDYGVVAVKAVVMYDSRIFEYVDGSLDTNHSFGGDANTNSCQYLGTACQIFQQETDKLIITVAKPSPGVQQSDSIYVASLSFKVKENLSNTVVSSQISLDYTPTNGDDYDDSDVILDDGLGTDILHNVVNTNLTIIHPACTFTYSDWSTCSYDAELQDYVQKRTASASPPDCVGIPDQPLTQECTHPSCESGGITAGSWSQCVVDTNQTSDPTKGIHTRTVDGTPTLCIMTPEQLAQYPSTEQCDLSKCTYTCGSWSECVGGTQTRDCNQDQPSDTCYVEQGDPPAETQSCDMPPGTPDCTSVTYGDWGACQPDGQQTREIKSATPDPCKPTADQTKDLTRSCEIPACKYNVGEWEDYCHSDLTQHRTVTLSSDSPTVCQGDPPASVQSCDKPGRISKGKRDNGDDHGHKPTKKKSSDKTKPTLNIPLYLTKNKGDKVWWTGADNKGIDHYTWSFAGKKGTTKASWMNISNKVGSGIHFLTLRAYDKAGNRTVKVITIRVR